MNCFVSVFTSLIGFPTWPCLYKTYKLNIDKNGNAIIPINARIDPTCHSSFFFFAGINIIRPTQRGLVERLGKYSKFAQPGFHWIIPVIDKMYVVNTTELMVDA